MVPARSLGLAPRSIQKALAQMVPSGAVQVRIEARRKSYSLAPGILDPLLETREPMLLASQWRRVMRAIAPDLAEAGMAGGLRSERSYPGEQYDDVFVEDVDRILAAAF